MIRIIAVGKIKERFYEDAVAEYARRLLPYTKFEIIQVQDEKCPEHISEKQADQIRDREGERILKNIRETEDFNVLLEKYARCAPNDNKATSMNAKREIYTTEIPFSKEGGVCQVKCVVNELPLYFIFDTGAYSVSISMVEATFMMKNGYLKPTDVIGRQRYMDANGNVSEGTELNLRCVKFGESELTNVRASVVQNQKAPLLLGQSVLSRLGQIEIDNARKVIKVKYMK